MKFKNLDLFNTPTSFTVDQNKKFQTNFGGYLTILSILICLICSIDIGQDFFFRRKPKISSESIYMKPDSPKQIDKDDLLIAWRLEDLDGNRIEQKEREDLLFYPNAKFNSYKREGTKFNKKFNKTLKSKKCSDYFKEKQINITFKEKDEWDCIDTSNITMGGYWDSEFLDYFEFSIESCQEEEGNQNIYRNCGDYDKLKEFFEKRVYISFMYGRVYNQNNNPDKPLLIEYNNFFKKLDPDLETYDICNFDYVNVYDNIGYIFENTAITRKLNFRSCTPNYTNNKISRYKEGKNNKLYWADYFLDNSFTQINRRYLKLSDVLSSLGGFFNITKLILAIIYEPVNIYKRNRYLINYFFKNEKEKPEEFEKQYQEFKDINKEYIINKKIKKSNENQSKIENYQRQVDGNSNDKNEELDENKILNKKSAFKNLVNKKKNNINLELSSKNYILNTFNNIDYKSFILKKSENPIVRERFHSENLVSPHYSKISELSISKKSHYSENSVLDDSERFNYSKNSMVLDDSERSHDNKNSEELDISQKFLYRLEKPNNQKIPIEYNNKILEEIKANEKIKANEEISKEKLQKEEIDKERANEEKYSPKNKFNFEKIIENIEKNTSFKNIKLVPYYLSCFRSNTKKNLYLSIEKGIFQINKKLELIRYLKNLEFLRVIGKVTLEHQERFFFKNHFKENLDIQGVYNKDEKNERNNFKKKQMIDFIKEKSNEDFSKLNRSGRIIFNNIFNNYHDDDF
jgi:hypothetical protein